MSANILLAYPGSSIYLTIVQIPFKKTYTYLIVYNAHMRQKEHLPPKMVNQQNQIVTTADMTFKANSNILLSTLLSLWWKSTACIQALQYIGRSCCFMCFWLNSVNQQIDSTNPILISWLQPDEVPQEHKGCGTGNLLEFITSK